MMPRTSQANPEPGTGSALPPTRFSFASAAWLLLGMSALTFVEFRAVLLIQGAHLAEQVQVAQGCLSGHPSLRAYQSRLLGPLLVGGLARAARLPFALAYSVVAGSLLLLSNAVCYRLFYLLGRSRRHAWGYALAYAGLFVALQDTEWLYLWDYVDWVTMLCFAFLVFTRPNLVLLAALFVVELLNREAAAFIGLWIMLEAARVPAGGKARRITISAARLLVGGSLIAAGALWTGWIRSRLFVAQTQPPSSNLVLGDQMWQASRNLSALLDPLGGGAGVAIVVMGALAVLLARPSVMAAQKKAKVGVLLGTMAACTLLFALINETRVWFDFAPFGLFLYYHLQAQPPRPCGAA